MGKTLRGLPTILVGMLLIAVLFTAYTAQSSLASHEPANKLAAAGSDTEVFGPGDEVVILSETVRVASPTDLILSVTLECSIITAIQTTNGDLSDSADGKIDIWIEIDGKRVPVSSNDDVAELGEVTFCNQVHQQQQTDSENPLDGVDTFDDYLRTKAANAFNWLALDVGFAYDDPSNGNNIVLIEVKAELEDTTLTPADQCQLGDSSCSEAIIGHRTLIAEPTNASVHEMVNEEDAGGS